MTWPAFFPPGCPPSDAVPAEGTVFRLIAGQAAQEVDAQPHRLRFPEKKYRDECQACGLSVYREAEDLQRLKRRVPAHAEKLIARIALEPGMGFLQPTPRKAAPDSHHTWWVPDGLAVWQQFQVPENEVS